MRIAFIDHSFHKQTGSSNFFCELIGGFGEIEIFYDDTWCHGNNSWYDKFHEKSFDLIIVWQVHEALSRLSGRHDNVVFVPMYDAMHVGTNFFWRKEFKAARCLSFSHKLHEEIIRHGGRSEYFRFFPDPSEFRVVKDFSNLRAYFWYRTSDIDAKSIFDLCEDTTFGEMTIHNAPDPGQEALRVPTLKTPAAELRITHWYASKESYKSALLEHNVYFAPRRLEGIGFSFLEAMATGMCVVGVNTPTMNEYIANGTNGLLYGPDRALPLNFARAKEMGERARESVERGFRAWERDKNRLLDYVFGGASKGSVDLNVSMAQPGGGRNLNSEKVSVVTVCRNAKAALEKTIQSVLSQDYEKLEYLIFDGASTDGTVEIIRRYAGVISYWQSESDLGVYYAMNSAIEKCSGRWILFMDAGATFTNSSALSRMFARVPASADIVYGHHFDVPVDGPLKYSAVADFAHTWMQLTGGELSLDWLLSIPERQATAFKRSILNDLKFNTNYRVAADHDLLFRAKSRGASFFNSDEVVTNCVSRARSFKNDDVGIGEWRLMARIYANTEMADQFCDELLSLGKGSSRQPISPLTSRDIAAACFVLRGFATPEGPYESSNLPRFRWAFGPSAEIEFRDGEYPQRIRMRMATFLRHQTVRFYADGNRVGMIRIRELWRQRGAFVEYVLDLTKMPQIEKLTVAFSDWEDSVGRPLAVMFSAIEAD